VSLQATKLEDKIDIVHTLVNSSLTGSMQSDFNDTTALLHSRRIIIEMNRERGREPTVEDHNEIIRIETKLETLGSVLADRHKQAKLVEKQLKQQAEETSK
jgi:hypothetical protein